MTAVAKEKAGGRDTAKEATEPASDAKDNTTDKPYSGGGEGEGEEAMAVDQTVEAHENN